MAKLTRLALFWRAFFLTLIFGTSSVAADPEDDAAWAAARAAGTPAALYRYLSLFPAGAYVDEAVGALSDLGAIRGLGNREPAPGRGGAGPRGARGEGADGARPPRGEGRRTPAGVYP